MADLGEDGEENEKQKGQRGDFFGGPREGASCAAEYAEEAQQTNRFKEVEKEAKTQQRTQNLKTRYFMR